MPKIIKAALICIKNKKLLIVHKKTIDLYISPGGKIEKGESDIECLSREVKEELGCLCSNIKYWDTFNATTSDNKEVELRCYFGNLNGEIVLNPEDNIDGFIWIGKNHKNIKMANSLKNKILPGLISRGFL